MLKNKISVDSDQLKIFFAHKSPLLPPSSDSLEIKKLKGCHSTPKEHTVFFVRRA